MNNYTNYIKIKEDFDLNKLIKLGFKKIDYTKGEIGYRYKGLEYEIKDYYELEDDGTRYVDNFGRDYRNIISINAETRIVWIEVINNDCSYHSEGDEVNFIANIILELAKLDCLEKNK